MRKKQVGTWIFLIAVLLFLYLPIIVVVLYSFNANAGRYTFSFTGFSLRHYLELFQDKKGFFKALRSSLLLAAASCGVSAVIGTLGAYGMAKKKFRLSGSLEMLSTLPIMLPEVILGLSLFMVFNFCGMGGSFLTLLIAHVTFTIPYIFITVKGRLEGMDPSLAEAARDLGAKPGRAFRDITLPLILPGVLSGVMLAFAMSLDDFVISYFVSGSSFTTLPIKVYSSVKTGVSLQINALSSLLIGAVALIVALAQAAKGKTKERSKKRGIQ